MKASIIIHFKDGTTRKITGMRTHALAKRFYELDKNLDASQVKKTTFELSYWDSGDDCSTQQRHAICKDFSLQGMRDHIAGLMEAV
ncbi:MAG TPA: hypothetical protein VMR45_01480 [Patescibacteria group bacterium]|nr:hypothetical protein [Patescibacteria group bacterium]